MFSQETANSLQSDVSLPRPRRLFSPPSPRPGGRLSQDTDVPRLNPDEYLSDFTYDFDSDSDDEPAPVRPPTPPPPPPTPPRNARGAGRRGGPRSTHWVFTLNNPTESEIAYLQANGSEPTRLANKIRYIIWGNEIGEHGTPHLQGYVQLLSVQRRSGLCTILGTRRCYLEPAGGTPEEASDYCKKGGDYIEFGNRIEGPGARSDLHGFIDTALTGGPVGFGRQLREFPTIAANHSEFAQRVNDYVAPWPVVEPYPLYRWQAQLYRNLMGPVDGRRVYFVWEPNGNCGKTWFMRYWMDNHRETSHCMDPGTFKDMAYNWRWENIGKRVLFIDFGRGLCPDFDYTFLEKLKDGVMTSTKYIPKTIHFQIPHVVVLMNRPPDMSGEKISVDRVIEIRADRVPGDE